jgi:hypothetical protein
MLSFSASHGFFAGRRPTGRICACGDAACNASKPNKRKCFPGGGHGLGIPVLFLLALGAVINGLRLKKREKINMHKLKTG